MRVRKYNLKKTHEIIKCMILLHNIYNCWCATMRSCKAARRSFYRTSRSILAWASSTLCVNFRSTLWCASCLMMRAINAILLRCRRASNHFIWTASSAQWKPLPRGRSRRDISPLQRSTQAKDPKRLSLSTTTIRAHQMCANLCSLSYWLWCSFVRVFLCTDIIPHQL